MENEKKLDENSGHEHKEHHLLSDIIKNVDTHFPLSGGETDEDLDEAIESTTDEDNENADSPDVTEREHLDTNFPLSGGTQ